MQKLIMLVTILVLTLLGVRIVSVSAIHCLVQIATKSAFLRRAPVAA
jgi:hypothetical protein